jgi:hypothetical protein
VSLGRRGAKPRRGRRAREAGRELRHHARLRGQGGKPAARGAPVGGEQRAQAQHAGRRAAHGRLQVRGVRLQEGAARGRGKRRGALRRRRRVQQQQRLLLLLLLLLLRRRLLLQRLLLLRLLLLLGLQDVQPHGQLLLRAEGHGLDEG